MHSTTRAVITVSRIRCEQAAACSTDAAPQTQAFCGSAPLQAGACPLLELPHISALQVALWAHMCADPSSFEQACVLHERRKQEQQH